MPASDPPDDLSGFPTAELRPNDPVLYRIVLARDPDTGVPRAPWFFSSLPAERPGRFDLPAPEGTCHLSDRLYGAWLEVFRGTGLVDRMDVARRRLVTATRSAARSGVPIATVRHDPTAVARTVALFGTAGPRTRLTGWRTTRAPLLGHDALMAEVARFGTGVLSRPFDVPLTAPPD